MRQNGLLLPNTHVISNRLEFDASGRAVAFDSHLIHSLNKNEAAAIDDHPYWEEVAHRPYVLLMGDALTDLQVCAFSTQKATSVAISKSELLPSD